MTAFKTQEELEIAWKSLTQDLHLGDGITYKGKYYIVIDIDEEWFIIDDNEEEFSVCKNYDDMIEDNKNSSNGIFFTEVTR